MNLINELISGSKESNCGTQIYKLEKNENKKYQQSASVIGQGPNFTIADCEKCSFGHCLVSKAWKSLLRPSESSRFLKSIIWWMILLSIDFLKEKCFFRIMKYQFWDLAYFLLEAVEASLCWCFKSFLMKLKWWTLSNMLTTMNVF